MVLCRLFSPPSLHRAGLPGAGSSGLCPAGHWASKDRNSTPTLGILCQCLTSFAIIRKGFFFCLGRNSIFLFVASYPITAHNWDKCLCCPLPRYFSTQLTVCVLDTCIPRAFPNKAAFHPLCPQPVLVHWGFPPSAGLCISFVELYKFHVGWLLSFPAWLNTNIISAFASLPRHLKAAEIPAMRSEYET